MAVIVFSRRLYARIRSGALATTHNSAANKIGDSKFDYNNRESKLQKASPIRSSPYLIGLLIIKHRLNAANLKSSLIFAEVQIRCAIVLKNTRFQFD